MKSKIQVFLGAVCLLTALVSLEPLSRRAMADDDQERFDGSWAFQFTGTISLPSPFNSFNGPFYRNGRFIADKHGNFVVTSAVSNYNGTVGHEAFAGTYVLHQDGTFTLTIVNLPVPPIAGIPNVFVFEGVLAGGGKTAKVVLSGVTLNGQVLPNIGSVIAGEFVKQ